jgi:hypothetical protein
VRGVLNSVIPTKPLDRLSRSARGGTWCFDVEIVA